MYKGFYIDKAVGNNAFSYHKRKNKQIYVPEMIEADFDDIMCKIKQSDKIAFSEYFDGVEHNVFGLENFLHAALYNKDIYIFDNHNHAFYFIANNVSKYPKSAPVMIHFDQHKDMRKPKLDLKDFDNIFSYTNYHLNVGNFIVPLKDNGFIEDVIVIDSSYSLYNLDIEIYKDIILDIDMDFFSFDMDYIDYEIKIDKIMSCYEKAKLVTICTSPYFIDFKRAEKYLGNILKKMEEYNKKEYTKKSYMGGYSA